eukprot:gene2722-2761_t
MLLLFSLTVLVPGDPASALLGPQATPEYARQFIAEMGLDQPVYVRFLRFFAHLSVGDFGTDVLTGRKVSRIIFDVLPYTVILTFASILLAVVIGIPLGALAATKPGTVLDNVLAVGSVAVIAVPSFVVAIVLLLVFSIWLDWLPVLGAGKPGDLADQATRFTGTLGFALVAIIVFAAITASWISPYDPDQLDVLHRFAGVSQAHWLGTDHLGRDLLSRVLHGASVAMVVSLAAISMALSVGTVLGALAAYLPSGQERVILVVFDIISSFPSLVLALVVVAVFGPSTINVIGIVAVTLMPQFGRVARAQVLGVKSSPFLEAEILLGAGTGRIFLRHLLPNIAGPLIVLASVEVPVVITVEAGLSFIGLGVRPPLASWGTLIYDGYSYLSDSALPVIIGAVDLVCSTPLHPYTAALLACELDDEPGGGRLVSIAGDVPDPVVIPAGCIFASRCALAEARCLEDAQVLRNVGDRQNVSMVYDGKVRALDDVSLTLAQREIVGLVGESGSGKTTLCRVMMGLVPPTEGWVVVDGVRLKDLIARDRLAYRRRAQMLQQDAMASLSPRMRLRDQLAEPSAIHGMDRAAGWALVLDLLAKMGLSQGATADVFARPAHPYTAALLSTNPVVDPAKRRARIVLQGEIPSVVNPPSGHRR